MLEFTTPTGTRDLIKQECKTKRLLEQQFTDIFERWGYEEIITPMVEYYQTFSIAQMKETEVYKILDVSNRILTLRADMTIPIVRVAATKFKDCPLPLRFQYNANVFKVKEELSGNQNERTDCGVELLGVEEPYGDLEILNCALDALSVLEDVRYTLEIGNLNFFKAACHALHLNDTVVDHLADLINRKSLKSLNDYIETLSLADQHKQFFRRLPWLCGNQGILEEARAYAFHEDLISILDQLQYLCEQLKELGFHEQITIDLGKIPRMKYYTGLIFEAFVEGVGISVLSGGRYDALGERFGRTMPAIGFSLRVDALMEVLFKKKDKKTITIAYPLSRQVEALKLAQSYRKTCIVQLQQRAEGSEIELMEGESTC